MTEAGPPLALDKDCFPTLVNSRGFKLWLLHTRTKMTHETYVFLERFGKPGGGQGNTYIRWILSYPHRIYPICHDGG